MFPIGKKRAGKMFAKGSQSAAGEVATPAKGRQSAAGEVATPAKGRQSTAERIGFWPLCLPALASGLLIVLAATAPAAGNRPRKGKGSERPRPATAPAAGNRPRKGKGSERPRPATAPAAGNRPRKGKGSQRPRPATAPTAGNHSNGGKPPREAPPITGRKGKGPRPATEVVAALPRSAPLELPPESWLASGLKVP